MRVLLRDLTPGQQYAIQFRSNDGAGNTSDWSQVQRFTTTNDTLHPGNVDPNGLTWYNTGTSFIAQWYPVTVNEDASLIRDLKDYHVAITNGATTVDFYTTSTSYEFTQAQCVQQFGSWQTALTVSVTARDLTYNESKTPATKAVNPANPPTPSAPGVSTYLGLLMATWNSQAADGRDMSVACKNFNYCEVHVFTQPNQPIPADNSSLVGRVFADGSGSKFVIPNLVYGQTYYVKLVAVNMLGKKSGPSAETSGKPAGISGIDIVNGQIAAEQINWTSAGIPGGNAYYSTSQPNVAMAVGGHFNVGDVWYDTDDAYTTYKWNGTTWALAPDVGFIPATKLIAGTITGDRIAANFFDAAYAHIGSAFIDSAMIQNINAGQIITGTLNAGTTISVGAAEQLHTEIRNTGVYVMTPIGGQVDPADPTGHTILPGTALMVPQIKMGAGTDGDAFAVLDPQEPDSTLANIDTGGGGSLQNLSVENDPLFQGQPLSQLLDKRSQLVGEGYVGPITGLNVADSSGQATGIRGEYGLGQFTFPVRSGRTYEISGRLAGTVGGWMVNFSSGTPEVVARIRLQKDQRTATDIQNGVAPTAVTINSTVVQMDQWHPIYSSYGNRNRSVAYWRSDIDGYVTVGYSLQLSANLSADAVLKIPDGNSVEFKALDLGPSLTQTGQPNSYGTALYNYVAPPPPPPPPPPSIQHYSWSSHAAWVRSYKSNGGYMTNTDGRAYQGYDPSGYNGNQTSIYGFNTNFASLLSGASNVRITLYLYYSHWYYNSGGTAVIGYHNLIGDPGTGGRPGGLVTNVTQHPGSPKPGGWNIDVSGWAGAMQNGSFQGIALGPGPSNSETYYGYATDCVLSIDYYK